MHYATFSVAFKKELRFLKVFETMENFCSLIVRLHRVPLLSGRLLLLVPQTLQLEILEKKEYLSFLVQEWEFIKESFKGGKRKRTRF